MGVFQSREEAAREAKRQADLEAASRAEVERVLEEQRLRKEWKDNSHIAETLFDKWKTVMADGRFACSTSVFRIDRTRYAPAFVYKQQRVTVMLGLHLVDEKTQQYLKCFCIAAHDYEPVPVLKARPWLVCPTPCYVTDKQPEYARNFFSRLELDVVAFVKPKDSKVIAQERMVESLDEISLCLKHLLAASDKKQLAAEVDGILADLQKQAGK